VAKNVKTLSVRTVRRNAWLASQDAGVVRNAKLASVGSLITKAGGLYDSGDTVSAEAILLAAVSASVAMGVKTTVAELRKISKS
jgi:hypothetical protein